MFQKIHKLLGRCQILTNLPYTHNASMFKKLPKIHQKSPKKILETFKDGNFNISVLELIKKIGKTD